MDRTKVIEATKRICEVFKELHLTMEERAAVAYSAYVTAIKCGSTCAFDYQFNSEDISIIKRVTERQIEKGEEMERRGNSECTFEIMVKGLTKEEQESLKETIDKEIRRIKYRRHKTEPQNLRHVIDLNS